MTDHIFAGPSLHGTGHPTGSHLQWHPPVRGGDLLRLQLQPGDRVCLIDGVFEAAPAVRHKEILLLLSRGVHVFGASSMGALRAAEMRQQGMKGFGRIYTAYARSIFVRDDWVALDHAPAALGFQPLTIALVDLIFGLQHAVRDKALHAVEARTMLRASQGLFYKDRSWATIEAASSLENNQLRRFRKWRDRNWFSQKTRDALECLASMNAPVEGAPTVPEYVDTPYLLRFSERAEIPA